MEAVLFDWDGTVADTWSAHAHAARAAIAGIRGTPPADPDIERFLLSPDEASSGLEPDEFMRVWQVMQPLYRAAQRGVRAFDGISQALAEIRKQGFALAVVTSKRRWAVSAELRALDLLQAFDAVVCREDTRTHKPAPEPLKLALRELGLDRALFVGDAVTDIQAAQAAPMPAVGVAWGWEGEGRLLAQNPDAVCDRVRDLPDVIERILRGEGVKSGRELG